MQLFRVLTIAGSDSGAGAGIQADLKTISALGCFGTSAVTAITAQNTQGVVAVAPLSPTIIRQQIRAVLDDIGADVIKIGMVSSCNAIVEELKKESVPILFDPLMISSSGTRLVTEEEVQLFMEQLFPLCSLITPNRAEAEVCSGQAITTRKDVEAVGLQLLDLGPQAVLITGGGQDGDCLVTRDEVEWFEGSFIATQNRHGTGCTLSSAIACYLARGSSLVEAVCKGKEFLRACLARFSDIVVGKGPGPVQPLVLTCEVDYAPIR